MSCVVGLVCSNEVILAGDSGGYGPDNSLEIRKDPKVFERGAMIFGFVGSFRMGQLIRYSLEVPRRRRGQDVFEFMATTFIEAFRNCLKAGGVGGKYEEDGTDRGGVVLVGYEGRLFRVDEDYCIAEMICGFDAIGDGGLPAIGALWAQELVLGAARRAKKEMGYSGGARVIDALTAAERSSTIVRRPFVTVSSPRPRAIVKR